MKKIKSLVAILLCMVTVLSLTGCGKDKEPISSSDFKQKLEEKGFSVIDSTHTQNTNNVRCSYVATSSNYEYQIEFIEFDSENTATKIYTTKQSELETERKNASVSSYVNISMANYAKYTLLVNGKYRIVSRIGNTLMYTSCASNKQEEVKEIFDELGY